MEVATQRHNAWKQVSRVFWRSGLAIFLGIGMVAAAGMILIAVEGGLASLLDVGQHIGDLLSATQPPPASSSYTGHILTIIIITLTVAGLFITVVSLAASAGLKTSIEQIAREVREDLASSVHDTVREMTSISHEGVRAQMASDRSVIEWRTHHARLTDPAEHRRALVRAYKNIEFAAREIELALHRLERSSAPEAAKENTRAGLQWLRCSILNNQAYYLAELYEEGLVATDSDLVNRGVLPDATEAIETAMKSADEAVRHVRNDGAVDAIQRLRFEETRLYVRYRMGAVDERDEWLTGPGLAFCFSP